MAGSKLHELTEGEELTGEEEVYGVRPPFETGDDRRWTIDQVKEYVNKDNPNAYSKPESNAKFVDVSGDTMTGSLALAGTPTAPSPPFGSNNQQIATTGFVTQSIAAAGGASTSKASSVLTDSATGVLIPGYVYPGNPYSDTTFLALMDTIRKWHAVPVIYVINPQDGPGIAWDGNYAAAIRILRAAGAVVIGYVSTAYAVRDPNLVKADVTTWAQMYASTPVDGIFFDEMPWEPGTGNANVTLYQSYYAWVYTQKLNMVVGNPGTNQQGIWYAANPPTADIIVTWETGVYPTESDLHGNYVDGHVDYSYKRNSILVHSQTFDAAKVAMMKKYAKWLWVTDDPLDPNPWDSFPSYMDTLFRACATLPT